MISIKHSIFSHGNWRILLALALALSINLECLYSGLVVEQRCHLLYICSLSLLLISVIVLGCLPLRSLWAQVYLVWQLRLPAYCPRDLHAL